jgi:hypothetical protein
VTDAELNKEQLITTLKSVSSAKDSYDQTLQFRKNREKLINDDFINRLETLLSFKSEDKFKKSTKWYSAKECSDYLSCIEKLTYSLIIKNREMANETLKVLSAIDPSYLSIEIDQKIRIEKRKKFRELFLKIVSMLREFDGDEKLRDLLFHRLTEIDDQNLQLIVNNIFDDIFNKKVEFDLSDYTYVVKNPMAWINRLERKDIDKLVSAYFSSPAARSIKARDLFLLRYFVPLKEKERFSLLKKFYKNTKNYGLIENMALASSIDNNLLRNSISMIDKNYKRPSFIIKRDIYRRQFEKTNDFMSLMKLIELGDQDEKFLWWFL